MPFRLGSNNTLTEVVGAFRKSPAEHQIFLDRKTLKTGSSGSPEARTDQQKLRETVKDLIVNELCKFDTRNSVTVNRQHNAQLADAALASVLGTGGREVLTVQTLGQLHSLIQSHARADTKKLERSGESSGTLGTSTAPTTSTTSASATTSTSSSRAALQMPGPDTAAVPSALASKVAAMQCEVYMRKYLTGTTDVGFVTKFHELVNNDPECAKAAARVIKLYCAPQLAATEHSLDDARRLALILCPLHPDAMGETGLSRSALAGIGNFLRLGFPKASRPENPATTGLEGGSQPSRDWMRQTSVDSARTYMCLRKFNIDPVKALEDLHKATTPSAPEETHPLETRLTGPEEPEPISPATEVGSGLSSHDSNLCRAILQLAQRVEQDVPPPLPPRAPAPERPEPAAVIKGVEDRLAGKTHVALSDKVIAAELEANPDLARTVGQHLEAHLYRLEDGPGADKYRNFWNAATVAVLLPGHAWETTFLPVESSRKINEWLTMKEKDSGGLKEPLKQLRKLRDEMDSTFGRDSCRLFREVAIPNARDYQAFLDSPLGSDPRLFDVDRSLIVACQREHRTANHEVMPQPTLPDTKAPAKKPPTEPAMETRPVESGTALKAAETTPAQHSAITTAAAGEPGKPPLGTKASFPLQKAKETKARKGGQPEALAPNTNLLVPVPARPKRTTSHHDMGKARHLSNKQRDLAGRQGKSWLHKLAVDTLRNRSS